MPQLRTRQILCLVLALAAAGCKEDDSIRAYTVPKQRQWPPRLLAAMIPAGEKIWFVKLSGAEPKVAAEKSAFEQFVTSIKFKDDKDPPTWSLPDGWRQIAGKTQTREATLRTGSESLEVSITALGKEASDLKSNVDRWRGQIGLKPVANAAELEAISRQITVDGKPVTLIDMTGVIGGSAMSTPREFSPNAAEPKGGSAPAPPPSTGTAQGSPLQYTVPAGWTEIPAKSMRVAAFQVSDGKQTAEVTIIPLSGAGGGLLANVNRWRKEVGLDDMTEENLRKESKSLAVEGQNAVYVDLVGKEKRNLGVILPRDGRTWFIKFQGPIGLVEKERENFEAFARSVRFAAGGRP